MDNKALVVTLVVVFVGGLVLGSASFGGLSGQAVGSTATVSASPKIVGPGQFVNIYVNPRGSDCYAYIYRDGVSRFDVFEYARGQGRACDQPTNYRYQVPLSAQASMYQIRVYTTQAATDSYASDTFTVRVG